MQNCSISAVQHGRGLCLEQTSGSSFSFSVSDNCVTDASNTDSRIFLINSQVPTLTTSACNDTPEMLRVTTVD